MSKKLAKLSTVRNTDKSSGLGRDLPRTVLQAAATANLIQLQVRVSPEVRKQIKLLAAETGGSQQSIFIDALNMLFAKHGKPPINEQTYDV